MSSRWANGTFIGLWESSSLTTVVNETTKALRTNWSTVRRQNDGPVLCVVASESAEFELLLPVSRVECDPWWTERPRSMLGQNAVGPCGDLLLTDSHAPRSQYSLGRVGWELCLAQVAQQLKTSHLIEYSDPESSSG